MNRSLHDIKTLVAALMFSGALGAIGWASAQSTSGDQSGAQTTTRPPAAASETSPSTKAIPPNEAETSDSAFKKLDANNKGYVTRDDANSISGFDRAFQSADANHDGKLTSDEFKKAWTSFTGNPQ